MALAEAGKRAILMTAFGRLLKASGLSAIMVLDG